jgi:hypothetical protein
MTTTYKPLRYRIKSIAPDQHVAQWRSLWWWETEHEYYSTIDEVKANIDKQLKFQREEHEASKIRRYAAKKRDYELKRWGFPKYEKYP